MPDMLVKLYDLPDLAPFIDRCGTHGYKIKRALMPEMDTLVKWVEQNFNVAWASECRGAFFNNPVSVFVAYNDKGIAGFACYDTTCRDFFGPTGVREDLRGKGLGAALLMNCLHAMAQIGYAYAIIGGAGPIDFYKKICNAAEIEGSVPGIYKDLLLDI